MPSQFPQRLWNQFSPGRRKVDGCESISGPKEKKARVKDADFLTRALYSKSLPSVSPENEPFW